MTNRFLHLLFFSMIGLLCFGQEESSKIFADTKVINTFSTTTLDKNILDIRIVHRFGDIAGNAGGWPTLYGLESAADISIGADYGLTDKVMIGLNRTKGAGPLRQLINLQAKWRFVEINTEKPFAIALAGMTSLSTMESSEDPTTVNYFPEFGHRLSYYAAVVVDKQFSRFLSLQGNISYVHRNYVEQDDENSLFLFGLAGKLQFSKTFAFLFDGSYPISTIRTSSGSDYQFPWGFGAQWETGGGHVFQVNIMNARGIAPTDYLANSVSDWGEGEYRLGFRISRLFRI